MDALSVSVFLLVNTLYIEKNTNTFIIYIFQNNL
jgi:hypothetical protein